MPKDAPDLFAAAVEARLKERGPLAARMRPASLDEMVGQRHLLGEGAPLRSLIDSDRLGSVILWGPPGTGKTTLSQLIATTTDRDFTSLSAVTAGVKDVREVIERARQRLGGDGRGTILFLDEVHRFNKAQQDALLPAVEQGVVTLIGATTENPFFEVNAPLISRSTVFRLHALDPDDLRTLLQRAVEHEKATADPAALDAIASMVDGDGRAALTTLEVALAIAGNGAPLEVEHVEKARQTRVLRYGEDEHYDIISAFIKSIRGSDPDAGLYWMARMLEAGEDARFIARRLVILASEDVGMADSMGLVVADAAARAVEFVGLPEATLNLAHAVVYLASAPKSNRVTVGINRAGADVRERPAGAVPPHLRQTHPYQRRKLDEGGGYVYPHDEPDAFTAQEHRPEEVADRLYYLPSDRGEEAAAGAYLRRLWGDDRYDSAESPRGK